MAGYHLYKQRNGSGKVSRFFSVQFTVAGEVVRRATGERDRGTADVRAAAIFLEEHRRAHVPVSAPGFDQLGDRQLAQVAALYLDDLKTKLEAKEINRAESYYDDAERDIRVHLVERFKRVDELTTKTWDAASKAWHGAGLKWRSIQRLTVTARHVLRFVAGLGMLGSVPELRAPKREQVLAEQAPRRAMTAAERTKFLAAVKKSSPRAWRIYVILFWSAMRRSDLRRLTLREINWKTGYINFPSPMTKSKKEGQQIWMHPKVRDALKAEIAELEKKTKKRPARKVAPDELLFPQFTVDKTGRKAIAAAGLDAKGLTPHHVTRHTTATLAGDAGASLAELMALGRWSSPQMAMRYMHENAKRSKAALKKL